MTEKEIVDGLVKKAKEYDADSFGKLYEIFYRRVFGYIYFKVLNEQDAEDLTSQTFIKVMEAIRSYDRRKGTFISWTLCIAHNTTIDFFRKNKKKSEIEITEEIFDRDRKVNPIDDLLVKIKNKEIWKKVAGLTENQRNVIFLKFGMGLSGKEISRIINKKEGAVKALMIRGLRTMKKMIEISENEETI